MRAIALSICLLCLLGMRSSAADGGEAWSVQPKSCEALSDGGFEAGRPNAAWRETTTGLPALNRSSLSARSGEWYASFGGQLFAALDQTLTQSIAIPLGRAELSFYIRIPETSSDPADSLTVMMDSAILRTFTILDAPDYPVYREARLDIREFADGQMHTLKFICHVSGDPVTTFRVDDVSLDSCPPLRNTEVFDYALNWRKTNHMPSDLISMLNTIKSQGK